MTRTQQIAAAFLVVVNAAVLMLVGLDVVHWTAAQNALVFGEANAVVALIVSLIAHFEAGTKKQPVAIQGSFIAVATGTTALLVGFHLWSLNEAQSALVISFVTGAVSLVATIFARAAVTAPTSPPLDA